MSTSTSHIFDTTGIRLPKDACVVIVRTDWNAVIVDPLEEGTRKVLAENGLNHEIIHVPGAFEIGFAIRHYFETAAVKPSAFIALGCVIRGDTPHFDYVCRAVTDSVVHLNMSLPVPVVFGVLTVDTMEQARERIGGPHGHKGEEAAATAIRMMHWMSSRK